jgi:hypothetical protein
VEDRIGRICGGYSFNRNKKVDARLELTQLACAARRGTKGKRG